MRYGLHSLFFVALLPWVAIAQDKRTEPSPVNNNPYYDSLLKTCEGRAGRACCRASVIAMHKETAHPADLKAGCPVGFKAVSLPCPASLNWCRPVGYIPPKN